MTITIQAVPPSLNKVLRMHWATKRKLLSAWEVLVFYATCLDERKKEARSLVRKRLRITLCHARPYDQDNSFGACKVVIDALKNLQLLVDDSPQWLETSVEQEQCAHKKRHTVIHLEPA